MNLCTADSLDKNFILELYQKAFPRDERKEYAVIERKAAMGTMEVLTMKEGKQRIGFAVTAVSDELVLVDYLAVAPEFRNMGYGTEAMIMLNELYGDQILFLEIREHGETSEEQEECRRRRDFYLRNGMLETGIHIEIFGVDMEILAAKPGLTYEMCELLYRSLYGRMYRDAVKLRK